MPNAPRASVEADALSNRVELCSGWRGLSPRQIEGDITITAETELSAGSPSASRSVSEGLAEPLPEPQAAAAAERVRQWEDILTSFDDRQETLLISPKPVVVPEVYELSAVILALSETGRPFTAKSPYLDAVLEHFGEFADHPAVRAVEKSTGPFPYFEFRENAYGFCFDRGEGQSGFIWRCQRFSHVFGTQNNSFATSIALIEDFASQAQFRDFFAARKDQYVRWERELEDLADVNAMRDWLNLRFPVKVDEMQIVISPLTNGEHSTQRFEDNGRVAVAMFVEPISNIPAEKRYMVERMLFTELDHNYVNFTLDAGDEIETGPFSSSVWVAAGTAGSYEGGFAVFAEYLTWALYEVWALETNSVPDEELKDYLDRLMQDRRGFLKYRAFADEFSRLYGEHAQRDGVVNIPDLYPAMLEWGRRIVSS